MKESQGGKCGAGARLIGARLDIESARNRRFDSVIIEMHRDFEMNL